jgi:ATP-dependent protease ClpP protease subunit
MKRNLPKLEIGVRPGVQSDVTIAAAKRWDPDLRAAAGEDEATISILDPIGADMWGDGVTAKRIGAALRAIGDRPVTVSINSPGGDVFEGIAIYNLLREHSGDVTVKIIGLAASAASVIAMAGDKVLIGRSSFLMIHNSWVIAMGNRNDLREVADWLEPFDAAMADVYQVRSGLGLDDIEARMDAETWINGATAVDDGFADGFLSSDDVAHGDGDDPSSSLRAEKKFDLLAKRAGLSRADARGLLKDLKGGTPAAAQQGVQDDAQIAGLLDDIRALTKTN